METMNPKVEELRVAVQELANQYGMNIETESMRGSVMFRLVLPSDTNGKGFGGYCGNLIWDDEIQSYRTFHYNGAKYKTLRGVIKAFSEWLKKTVEDRRKERDAEIARTTAIDRIRTIAGVAGNKPTNGDDIRVTTKKYDFDLVLSPSGDGRVSVKMGYCNYISVGQLAELLGNL
jgi:hypothetical protein